MDNPQPSPKVGARRMDVFQLWVQFRDLMSVGVRRGTLKIKSKLIGNNHVCVTGYYILNGSLRLNLTQHGKTHQART